MAHIRFAEGTSELVAQAVELLGESLASDYLRESYREGETFSNAYSPSFTPASSPITVSILLDPADAELHRIATPLFVSAMRRPRNSTTLCWRATAN